MSRRVFVWGEDDGGRRGWIMKGMSHFDAALGDTVGHDTMEHFPGGIKHGAIADEMLALGARLQLRVASHWLYGQRFTSTAKNVWGSELCQQLEYIFAQETPEPPAPRTRPDPDRMDEEMESVISEALTIGFAKFNKELEYGMCEGLDPLDPNSELARNMGDWMRIGVLAAQKRWNSPAGSFHDAMMLQENLAHDVERLSKHREDGEELIVEINERRMRVECRVRELHEVYPEDIYA